MPWWWRDRVDPPGEGSVRRRRSLPAWSRSFAVLVRPPPCTGAGRFSHHSTLVVRATFLPEPSVRRSSAGTRTMPGTLGAGTCQETPGDPATRRNDPPWRRRSRPAAGRVRRVGRDPAPPGPGRARPRSPRPSTTASSRPITQIEALELDDHAALPDEVLAVSTLRRYATLLGLDGDVLATQFEAERRAADVDAVGHPVHTGRDQRGGRRHHRARPPAGVHRDGRGAPGRRTGHVGVGRIGQLRLPGVDRPPDGHLPGRPRGDLRKSRRSVARARRRMKAPTWLKILTWIVAVLVLVMAAGWVLLSVKPTVLANAHILRVVPPGRSTSGAGGGSPSRPPAPARQTFPVQPAGTHPVGRRLHGGHVEVQRGGGHVRSLLGPGDQLLVGCSAGQWRPARRTRS